MPIPTRSRCSRFEAGLATSPTRDLENVQEQGIALISEHAFPRDHFRLGGRRRLLPLAVEDVRSMVSAWRAWA
jgi:hypothetical protein